MEDQNLPIVLILDSATSRASLNSPNSMLLMSSLASMKKSAPQASRCGDGLPNLKGWNLGMGMYVYQIICIYIQYDSYLIYDVIIYVYIYIHTGLKMRKHRGYVLFMDPNFRVEKNISLQLGISFMKAFTRETRFLLATSLVISRCGELPAI